MPKIAKQLTDLEVKNLSSVGRHAVGGARPRETVKVGKAHPQYKHGERTKEAIQKYRKTMSELQKIERLGYEAGLFVGPRTGGRKVRL